MVEVVDTSVKLMLVYVYQVTRRAQMKYTVNIEIPVTADSESAAIGQVIELASRSDGHVTSVSYVESHGDIVRVRNPEDVGTVRGIDPRKRAESNFQQGVDYGAKYQGDLTLENHCTRLHIIKAGYPLLHQSARPLEITREEPRGARVDVLPEDLQPVELF